MKTLGQVCYEASWEYPAWADIPGGTRKIYEDSSQAVADAVRQEWAEERADILAQLKCADQDLKSAQQECINLRRDAEAKPAQPRGAVWVDDHTLIPVCAVPWMFMRRTDTTLYDGSRAWELIYQNPFHNLRLNESSALAIAEAMGAEWPEVPSER